MSTTRTALDGHQPPVPTTMSRLRSVARSGATLPVSLLNLHTPYYAEHFQQIKSVILLFNPVEAAAIKEIQIKFQDVSVETALKTIHSNYKSLYQAIEKIQNGEMSSVESEIADEAYINQSLRVRSGEQRGRLLSLSRNKGDIIKEDISKTLMTLSIRNDEVMRVAYN
ncbi:hypothetical protein NQ318_013840 [Aromia moschata]|uniref:Uncharacterized protein n=1 Tax=Aromia moschata TaxID=1265417 RepID=A0AAV8ZAP9_9CUCU|nr:hypothetical protein NQ318_013840 [Aromia moschata]